MSRITESLRRLIREEVHHMLNRLRLREGTGTSSDDDLYLEKIASSVTGYNYSQYDCYYDAVKDMTYLFGLAGSGLASEYVGETFSAFGDIRNTSNQVWEQMDANVDDVQSVYEAMQAADAADAAAAADAPAAAPADAAAPAKRRRAPQDIVRQIQTALGMTDADGIWGPKTDAAWSAWLDAHSNITFNNNKTIEDLKKSWAKNSKYIKMINNYGKMDTSSGTVENMLKFIKYAEKVSDDVPDAQRSVASAPTAEKSYADMNIEELQSIYKELAAAEKSIADREGFYGSSKHSEISADLKKLNAAIIDKIKTANTAEADKLKALANKFEDSDEFKFDSGLAESRWLRLAGILKG